MAKLSLQEMQARSTIFNKYALQDQKAYYHFAQERYEKSAQQVNRIRATMSLLTGLAAAVAGLIVTSVFTGTTSCNPIVKPDAVNYCNVMSGVILLASVVAVVAPALGGAFSTLADLYQWDRLTGVYENALKTINIADAYSPDEEMDAETYRASMIAFSEGAIQVMEDESAQWGQLIRPPQAIQDFLTQAEAKSEQVAKRFSSGASGPQHA